MDDFLDRAARKGEDRRAARHRFDHHQTERLLPLNREQEGASARQQAVLLLGVRFSHVLDLHAVDFWRDLLFPVVAEHRLHFAGELQSHAGATCGLNRQMRAFTRRHPAEKCDVVLLRRRTRVVVYRNPVVDDVHAEERLAPRQPRADRDIVDIRVPGVLLRQRRFMRMVHGHDDGLMHEPRKRDAGDVVEMNHVDTHRGVAHRP